MHRATAWLIVIGGSTWLLDFVTKYFASKLLISHIQLLPGLALELNYNSNLAFGLPLHRWFTIFFSLIAIAAFIYLYAQKSQQKSWWTIASFGLVFGGAFGNLQERVCLGAVTDFIVLGPIPNFNLADMALVIGIAILILFQNKIFKT